MLMKVRAENHHGRENSFFDRMSSDHMITEMCFETMTDIINMIEFSTETLAERVEIRVFYSM